MNMEQIKARYSDNEDAQVAFSQYQSALNVIGQVASAGICPDLEDWQNKAKFENKLIEVGVCEVDRKAFERAWELARLETL